MQGTILASLLLAMQQKGLLLQVNCLMVCSARKASGICTMMLVLLSQLH